MIDRSNNLTWVDFEITHRCNKYCKLCSHRCSTSDYEMSIEDYNYVTERIGSRSDIERVLVIGGEPLKHRNFEELIGYMSRDFPEARITVQTNGRLLDKYFDLKVDWVMTHYPGWNDAVCERCEQVCNVMVSRMGGLFWNPFVDPDFDEETAKRAREGCTFSVRILGRRLYSCCISEPIERDLKLSGVSIPFTTNWRTEIREIETWKACQHCFRASHIINDGELLPPKTERHNA